MENRVHRSRPSNSRSRRLCKERQLLREHFPDARWLEPERDLKVELHITSRSGRTYSVRLYVPDDYPNSCPSLAIKTPLCDRNRNPLPHISKEFRTIGIRDDHFLMICHCNPGDWRGHVWMYTVFQKAHMWVEAYEGYLETGDSLDTVYQRIVQETSASGSHEGVNEDPEWTPQQGRQLLHEKRLIELHHSQQYQVSWSEDNRQVDITVNDGNKLRCYIPADFPNGLPKLAIILPKRPRLRDGREMPDGSDEFRTLRRHEGFTTICHYSVEDWRDNMHIHCVITKGIIWLDAYQSYITHNNNDLTFLFHLQEKLQPSSPTD